MINYDYVAAQSWSEQQWEEYWKKVAYDTLERQRAWDSRLFPTTVEYDDHFEYLDNLKKNIPEGVSQVEEKFVDFRDLSGEPLDQYKNQYFENPEDYLPILKKRFLTHMANPERRGGFPQKNEELGQVAQLPPDMIHLHPAIFHKDEIVTNMDPTSGKPMMRYWWDEDVIDNEFAGVPRPQDAVEHKVDWYLKQTEKQ